MLNPMHRLWSDGRWNKLTVAHGCYWKKCSFCDVGLDYIGRYETASATVLADRIDTIVRETGQTGFHFVDEAAPPKALKALATELIARDAGIPVGTPLDGRSLPDDPVELRRVALEATVVGRRAKPVAAGAGNGHGPEGQRSEADRGL